MSGSYQYRYEILVLNDLGESEWCPASTNEPDEEKARREFVHKAVELGLRVLHIRRLPDAS